MIFVNTFSAVPRKTNADKVNYTPERVLRLDVGDLIANVYDTLYNFSFWHS